MKNLRSRHRITRIMFALIGLLMLLTAGSGLTTDSVQAQTSGVCRHIVVRGETLFRIGLRYGVSVYAIAEVNNIYNINLIFPGQALLIPTTNCGYTPPAGRPIPTTTGGVGNQVYTVVSGDTLARISQRFGVTVSDLVIANNISALSMIFVGQQLIIPARRYTGVYYPTLVPGATQQPQIVPTAQGTPVRPANCGTGFHQINCWPTFGGNFDYNSIATEPAITVWKTCVAESTDGVQVCSKTGLGYFGATQPALPAGWSLSGNILFTTEANLAAVQAHPSFAAIQNWVRLQGYTSLIVFTSANSDVVPL